MITIIVAVGKNNAIGKDNSLLWHLPNDLKRFKKLTLNSPIIMGRKTFESLPGVLPKRPHIVISRNEDYKVDNPNVLVVHSLEKALEEAQKLGPHQFIIGGGNIYKQSMDLADTLEVTVVDAELDADTYFPEISEDIFKLTYREYHPKNEKHKYDYEFQRWERIK